MFFSIVLVVAMQVGHNELGKNKVSTRSSCQHIADKSIISHTCEKGMPITRPVTVR